jgi:hypothetical protein
LEEREVSHATRAKVHRTARHATYNIGCNARIATHAVLHAACVAGASASRSRPHSSASWRSPCRRASKTRSRSSTPAYPSIAALLPAACPAPCACTTRSCVGHECARARKDRITRACVRACVRAAIRRSHHHSHARMHAGLSAFNACAHARKRIARAGIHARARMQTYGAAAADLLPTLRVGRDCRQRARGGLRNTAQLR